QRKAQKKYDEKNREKRSYVSQRSTSRGFIRNKATLEDLEELEELITARKTALAKNYGLTFIYCLSCYVFHTGTQSKQKSTTQQSLSQNYLLHLFSLCQKTIQANILKIAILHTNQEGYDLLSY